MKNMKSFGFLRKKCGIFPSSFLMLCFAQIMSADEIYNADFSEGKWNSQDWKTVKSSRWEHVGEWIQKKDCIENKVPSDATEDEMIGVRAGETYSSMILNRKFSGSLRISCRTSFDHRMAPEIIIAAEPVKTPNGILEYREHFEVVIYDKGINVWHHFFVDGKQQWRKKAFIECDFSSQKKYDLNVMIEFSKKGPVLSVEVDGKSFGYIEDALPKEFYVGIAGCEGINSFYSFSVSK